MLQEPHCCSEIHCGVLGLGFESGISHIYIARWALQDHCVILWTNLRERRRGCGAKKYTYLYFSRVSIFDDVPHLDGDAVAGEEYCYRAVHRHRQGEDKEPAPGIIHMLKQSPDIQVILVFWKWYTVSSNTASWRLKQVTPQRDPIIQRRLEGPLQKPLTLPPRNAQHLLRQRQETESNPNAHQSHSYKEI